MPSRRCNSTSHAPSASRRSSRSAPCPPSRAAWAWHGEPRARSQRLLRCCRGRGPAGLPARPPRRPGAALPHHELHGGTAPIRLPRPSALRPLVTLSPRLPPLRRRMGLSCARCSRTFDAGAPYLDLTLTSGVQQVVYSKQEWGGVEIFRCAGAGDASFAGPRQWPGGAGGCRGRGGEGGRGGVRGLALPCQGRCPRPTPASPTLPASRGRRRGPLALSCRVPPPLSPPKAWPAARRTRLPSHTHTFPPSLPRAGTRSSASCTSAAGARALPGLASRVQTGSLTWPWATLPLPGAASCWT
jgi:hypothetical protein